MALKIRSTYVPEVRASLVGARIKLPARESRLKTIRLNFEGNNYLLQVQPDSIADNELGYNGEIVGPYNGLTKRLERPTLARFLGVERAIKNALRRGFNPESNINLSSLWNKYATEFGRYSCGDLTYANLHLTLKEADGSHGMDPEPVKELEKFGIVGFKLYTRIPQTQGEEDAEIGVESDESKIPYRSNAERFHLTLAPLDELAEEQLAKDTIGATH